MVAQHTPFEYEPTDSGMRRVERARLSFKPSEQLRDSILEFVRPNQRERVLGRRGLFLYSNYSWDVFRKPNGTLEPRDAIMESDFRKIQKMNDRKMKLMRFAVCKEVMPPDSAQGSTLLVALKVRLDDRQAQAMHDNPRIPKRLIDQYSVPVHIAFPEGIAIPSAYRGSAEAQLERFVLGSPERDFELLSSDVSPNIQATVSDMQLAFKPKITHQ